jgi:hypothetical protein
MFSSWLAVLALAPLGLVSAAEASFATLSKLASSAPNGVIPLDAKSFDLLTSPHRNWTATIHFTALDPRRRCGPCKCVRSLSYCVMKLKNSVGSSTRPSTLSAKPGRPFLRRPATLISSALLISTMALPFSSLCVAFACIILALDIVS